MAINEGHPLYTRLRRRIRDAQEAVSASEYELGATVRDVRAQGMTWAQIGDIVGTSRQAAQARYGVAPAPRLAGRD